MATRVGINGFGRIGRQVTRAIIERHPCKLTVAAVNDLGDPATNAHLFKYDTNYGAYPGDVGSTDDSLLIDGSEVKVLGGAEPGRSALGRPRRGHRGGVDRLLHRRVRRLRPPWRAARRRSSSPRPRQGEDATLVLGVNEDVYDPASHNVVSNASCTTNCIATMTKVPERQLRRRARPDDDDPLLHRRPEHPGQGARGPQACQGCGAQHHPDDDRRGQGGRAGAARAERQDHTAWPSGCRRRPAR